MPYKDPAKQQEASKKWIEKNQERWKEYQREYKRKWRLDHPDEARDIAQRARLKEGNEKRNARHRAWHHKNKETQNEKDRIRANQYRKALRAEVIAAYGGKCWCCGETIFDFLTIDHILGGGNKHREILGGSSVAVYLWLKRKGFPQEGFRCLCMNCQFGYANNDVCPHQLNKTLIGDIPESQRSLT